LLSASVSAWRFPLTTSLAGCSGKPGLLHRPSRDDPRRPHPVAQGRAYALELVAGGNPLEEMALRLAKQACDLLASFDPARLKICGNRAKARRFYSRKKLVLKLG